MAMLLSGTRDVRGCSLRAHRARPPRLPPRYLSLAVLGRARFHRRRQLRLDRAGRPWVTALVFFALRLVAVGLFEITNDRWLFFVVGPNIFENFYLFIAGMLTIDAAYRIRSMPHLVAIVLFVGVPRRFRNT